MFIRVECRDALKAAIEAQTTVPVLKGFHGVNVQHEAIHLDDTNGTVTYEVFAGAKMPRDDTFSIDVYVHTNLPGQDQDAAETRAQALMNAVDNALEDATFTDLEVTSANCTGFVFDAIEATVDGPHTAPTEEGFEAYGLIEVAVHTRSRYT